MIIDGRVMAQNILNSVKEIMSVKEPFTMRAIVVAPTAATQSYLRAKARAAELVGIQFEAVELPKETSTQEVIDRVNVPGADSIIVQLPLPAPIDAEAVLAAIPPEKDADALTPAAREAGVVPPVAAAVEEILIRSGVEIAGKQVTVIGKGRLVGAPVAARLVVLGANVTAYDVHDFQPSKLLEADIVVSGAGVPSLVKADMIKDGAVLIDAGTSEAPSDESGEGNRLAGDIDPAAAQKASLYTPVPGGVGPVTVACLLRNAAKLRS